MYGKQDDTGNTKLDAKFQIQNLASATNIMYYNKVIKHKKIYTKFYKFNNTQDEIL